MNETPCPTCKGFCCADGDDRGPHVVPYENPACVYWTHACPDCEAGHAPPPLVWTTLGTEHYAMGYAATQRAPVPGGHLYRIAQYISTGDGSVAVAVGGLAFAPKVWT